MVKKEIALKDLYELFSKNGFITFEDILNECEKVEFSDVELAKFYPDIISAGIKIGDIEFKKEIKVDDTCNNECDAILGELSSKAIRGDVIAQKKLGDYYSDCENADENQDKAFRYYLQAAEQGDSEAQNSVGDYYYDGYFIEKDYDKAIKWYKLAAEKGNTEAMYALGYSYLCGEGAEKNHEEAIKWFQKAAQNGYDLAINFFIESYMKGENGLPKDKNEVLKWFKIAAEMENSSSPCDFAEEYFNGNQDIAEDHEMALKLYEIAAENKFLDAKLFLGEYYLQNASREMDIPKAVNYLKDASECADESIAQEAIQDLVEVYWNGEYVDKNYSEALNWLKMGSELGYDTLTEGYNQIKAACINDCEGVISFDQGTFGWMNLQDTEPIGVTKPVVVVTSIQGKLKSLSDKYHLTGGPGTEDSNAIVINVKDQQECSNIEKIVLKELYPGYEIMRELFEGNGEKCFDVFTISYDKVNVEAVYFDVSCSRKISN